MSNPFLLHFLRRTRLNHFKNLITNTKTKCDKAANQKPRSRPRDSCAKGSRWDNMCVGRADEDDRRWRKLSEVERPPDRRPHNENRRCGASRPRGMDGYTGLRVRPGGRSRRHPRESCRLRDSCSLRDARQRRFMRILRYLGSRA